VGRTSQSLGLRLDIVILGTKELGFMARIERPELRTRSGPCAECGKKTRSHELEPAEYEEYMQQVVTNRSDEFSAKKWEDFEEELRSEIAIEPIVMCHSCWSEKQEGFRNKISTKYDSWNENPIANAAFIRKSMETIKYYDFDDVKIIDMLTKLVRRLKEAALGDR
jgi:hypothetical protein